MSPLLRRTSLRLIRRISQVDTETQRHGEKRSLIVVIILSVVVATSLLGLVITLVICKCRRDRKTRVINARFSQQAPTGNGGFSGHGASGMGMGNRSVITAGGGAYQRLENVGETDMREGGVWSVEMELQGHGRVTGAPGGSTNVDGGFERRRSLSTIGEESASVGGHANRSSGYHEVSHLGAAEGREQRPLKDIYR
ncbi:hypothetical protein IQ07DRAFT_636047 [Pyrenochaeta sp. DS3sAY3a]|nr:hypothetical protein IQ07DRAFT_636047 [Pyrenochaeta sp. DS3sAY3a]